MIAAGGISVAGGPEPHRQSIRASIAITGRPWNTTPPASLGPDFSRIPNAKNIFQEHRKPARADTELQQTPRHGRPFSNHRDFP